MPKIRDLGINAIPATAKPLEIGPGGGGGGGGAGRGGGGGCSDGHSPPPKPPDTPQDCGGEHSPHQGVAAGGACQLPHSPAPQQHAYNPCHPFFHSPIPYVPNAPVYIVCDPSVIICDQHSPSKAYGQDYAFQCSGEHSPAPRWDKCTGEHSPGYQCSGEHSPAPRWDKCTGEHSPPPPYKGLTKEAVAELKGQLEQRLKQLDEYARTLGPKTIAEVDAREKELKAELEQLAKRRKELQKKK